MAKKEKPTTKICKYCCTDIPYAAKVCPNCRKRVKRGKAKWIILAIIALFILIGMGGEETEIPEARTAAVDSEKPEEKNQQNTEKPIKKDKYCVGDVLLDGDMKIVYMSSGEYKEDNQFSLPEEGNKYIFLQFSFENTSVKNDASVSFYSFEGYADGYAVDMYYASDDALSASLSPGRTETGYIYFEVPENAAEIEIEYIPNMFLDDKYIFVYEGEKDSGYVPEVNTTVSENAYHVGDIVESKEMTIKYLSCAPYTSDNMFVEPKAGHCFMSFEFEFDNQSDSDQYVSSFDFYCYADGKACDATYIRDDDLSATLSSGRKTKGTVTFEVPVYASVIEVEYLSNYWTSDRVVFAAE